MAHDDQNTTSQSADKYVIAIAGENFDLKEYARHLKLGVTAPSEFYQQVYPTLSFKQIAIGYGLAVAAQVILSVLFTFTLSNIVAIPLRLAIAQLVVATAIFIFGKLFCNLEDEFQSVLRWTSWAGTYVALFGSANIVLAVVLPLPVLAFVAFCFTIGILYFGLKHAFQFSQGQSLAFMAVPASLAAIGLALTIIVGLFSSSLPFVGLFDQDRIEAVLGDDVASEPESSDLAATINSLVNNPEQLDDNKADGHDAKDIKSVPDLRAGESYTYLYQSLSGSEHTFKVTTANSELADEDLKLTFSLKTDEGLQTHDVFLPKGAKITSIETTMHSSMQLEQAHPVLRKSIEQFFATNSAMVDGIGAAAGLMSLLVPKSALKKEGIDLSTKKVKIAGRQGIQRQIGSAKDGSLFIVTKDNSLPLPLLEATNETEAGTTILRLTSYQLAQAE